MATGKKKKNALALAIIATVLCVALAAGMYILNGQINDWRAQQIADAKAQVEAYNREQADIYREAVNVFNEETRLQGNKAWPEHPEEGWAVIDLTNYPLEEPYTVSVSRSEIMNNGMLLVNAWHARPDDFSETQLVSLHTYVKNELKGSIQVKNSSVRLFPVAARALYRAIADANLAGLDYFYIDEGYRSYQDQAEIFNSYMKKYEDRYSGEALIERTKKEVNYPGTSEFNSGLSFTMKLYKKGDSTIGSSDYYMTSPEGVWMNENLWKYGIVFRFPRADFPLPGTTDKSTKTGINTNLRCYRYVGEGNAAVMHIMDFCMEDYMEYLFKHPHLAVYEDGVLKYEIFRQEINDSDSDIVLNLNRRAIRSESSLDNMNGVITVFFYE